MGIPTANDDASRIAELITDHEGIIDDIIVSLDTHKKDHIAHGIFWEDSSKQHPESFTTISKSDVESGVRA